ncbi:hypothetical protein NIES4101_74080 [Calothrix sp. NIES-4101]|nr:hypothetical protein NIES4101_74080 [Calothrix sp. NIES-4101]
MIKFSPYNNLKQCDRLLFEIYLHDEEAWHMYNEHLQNHCDHGTLADAIAILQTLINAIDEDTND